jgi:hypothetical protein
MTGCTARTSYTRSESVKFEEANWVLIEEEGGERGEDGVQKKTKNSIITFTIN